MKIRITKKGLPKAQGLLSQPGVELRTSVQPNYNWMTLGQTMPANPMPGIPRISFPNMMVDDAAAIPPEVMQQQPARQNNMAAALGIYPGDATDRQIQARYDGDPAFQKQYDDSVGAAMIKGLKPFDSRKDMKSYVDFYNKKYKTNYKLPFMTPDRMKLARTVSGVGDALFAASSVVDYFGQNEKARAAERALRQNFLAPAVTGEFEGNYTTNTGVFQPNQLPIPNEGMFAYGGINPFNENPMPTIRITSAPNMQQMAYGGQSDYGLDIGQRKFYTDMPDSKQDTVSSTIGAVPRSMANIEAEGGETVYGDLDGDGGLEHMKITGPRHSNGGVPLNVPEGSFIFSDTRKMKIKDPEILKLFGKSYKKGGYTPAAIAKQYDINKYKAIMEDPNASDLDKGTAQLMVKNYQGMLGLLSVVQEGIKDFPQGMPAVAQAAMGASQMAYGGYALPRYQKKGQVKLGDWADDYEQLQTLLMDPKNAPLRKELFSRYKSSRGANDNISEDQYIKNLLEAQRQVFALQSQYKDNPNALNEAGWDRGGRNARYNKELQALGLTALSEDDIARFQSAYMDMADLIEDDRFKENFGKYFQINPQGKKDQVYKNKPISGPDKWWGNTTNRQFFQLRDAEPVPQQPKTYFFCTGRTEGGMPQITTKTFNTPEEAAAAGYVGSEVEAARLCGIGDIDPNPLKPGVKSSTPFKMLFPDKLNMLAAAAIPPRAQFPYSPDLAYRPGDYALPDWLAKAQQLQQSYNVAADTMGTYGPASALATNMSFLAGQTGNAVTAAQDQTGQQAVGIFNEYTNRELGRQDRVDMYNTMNAKDRYDNAVRARQAYDNSRRQYINNLAKGYSNAWNNRMKMGLLNSVNPIYNINPDTGRSYFMEGYGPSYFSSIKNTQGMSPDNLKKFTAAKNKYKAADMSDNLAERLATKEIFGITTPDPGVAQMLELGFGFNPGANTQTTNTQ